MFVNVVGQLSAPSEVDGEWVSGVWKDERINYLPPVVRLLTHRLTPTRLDSVRMARVAQSALEPDWVAEAGKKLIIFRGQGGTGKTMLLLQLAWKLYQDLGARVLILTYNKALLADIRRLLTLIGI